MGLKTRAAGANQRARELGLAYNLHKDDIIFALNFFEFKCAYCGCELDVNFNCDHIIPISEESLDVINFGSVSYNIICVCERCNVSKHTTTMENWVRSNFENHEEVIYKITEYQNRCGINEILY